MAKMRLMVVCSLALFLGSSAMESPPEAAGLLAESDAKFFDDVIEERESHSPATEKWNHQVESVEGWAVSKKAKAIASIKEDCATEKRETAAWIALLKKEMDAEDENDSADAVDEAVAHLVKALGARVTKLRSMLSRLNDHIARVNDIFSTAHLVTVTDMLAMIFKMRTGALALRSEELFQDPIFNKIKMDAPAMATSFIDLSSYSQSMENIADEAQAHLDRAKANGDDDGDLKKYCGAIQDDVGSWKEMKVKFEGERKILALLRDDVMALFTQRTEQLENLEAAHHDINNVPESVDTEEAEESAAPATKKRAGRFAVIPLLEAHMEHLSKECVQE